MWPHSRRALRLLSLAVLVLIIAITFLLYPLYGGYYLASTVEPEPGGGPVLHLTEDNFRAHPALHDLVVEKEKVRRPSPFLSSRIMWQDESVMDGWSAHVLTRLEDQALLRMTAPMVLEYEGSYVSIAVVRG